LNYAGTIHASHLPSPSTQYKEFQLVTARVIYVDYETKTINLSLRPHLVAWRAYTLPAGMQIGTVIDQATIIEFNPMRGLKLLLENSDTPEMASVSITDAYEESDTAKKVCRQQLPLVLTDTGTH
jgi:transcriptional accessory protein Tex/SPT6